MDSSHEREIMGCENDRRLQTNLESELEEENKVQHTNANRKCLGHEYVMFGTKRGRGQRRNNNDPEELCLKKVGLLKLVSTSFQLLPTTFPDEKTDQVSITFTQ